MVNYVDLENYTTLGCACVMLPLLYSQYTSGIALTKHQYEQRRAMSMGGKGRGGVEDIRTPSRRLNVLAGIVWTLRAARIVPGDAAYVTWSLSADYATVALASVGFLLINGLLTVAYRSVDIDFPTFLPALLKGTMVVNLIIPALAAALRAALDREWPDALVLMWVQIILVTYCGVGWKGLLSIKRVLDEAGKHAGGTGSRSASKSLRIIYLFLLFVSFIAAVTLIISTVRIYSSFTEDYDSPFFDNEANGGDGLVFNYVYSVMQLLVMMAFMYYLWTPLLTCGQQPPKDVSTDSHSNHSKSGRTLKRSGSTASRMSRNSSWGKERFQLAASASAQSLEDIDEPVDAIKKAVDSPTGRPAAFTESASADNTTQSAEDEHIIVGVADEHVTDDAIMSSPRTSVARSSVVVIHQ